MRSIRFRTNGMALVALVVLTLAGAGIGLARPQVEAGDSTHAISSCTGIDEPGEYELVANVDGDAETCLAVRASDVLVDGNGYTVAGPGNGTGIRVAGGGFANVTVRDVAVSDWSVGVQVGGDDGTATAANLIDVRVLGSDTGLRLTDADDSALQAVTALRNQDGIVLVDTAEVTASGLTAADNNETGLWLAGGVTNSSFNIVRAMGNGDVGVYVATGAVDNFIGDATITGNGGPGVEFVDSSDNVLADSRVDANGGPGVLSYPADGDRLQNVVFSGNSGGAYRNRGTHAGAVGETVRLANGTSVTFEQGITRLASVDELSPLPDGARASGSAVDVTVREPSESPTATVTIPVESPDTVVVYQHLDGEWERTTATVADGAVEIPVSSSGIFVPVAGAERCSSTSSVSLSAG